MPVGERAIADITAGIIAPAFDAAFGSIADRCVVDGDLRA